MKYFTKHYVYEYTYNLLLMGKQFKEMHLKLKYHEKILCHNEHVLYFIGCSYL